jgi:hypothetical protein
MTPSCEANEDVGGTKPDRNKPTPKTHVLLKKTSRCESMHNSWLLVARADHNEDLVAIWEYAWQLIQKDTLQRYDAQVLVRKRH